ncbi:hypothetical protein [Salegentibacter sediminis]|uniref:hypothetical protein n=1 Tax=Salegentibacter sediminis TaxID=1930251 RepID=UPI0009C05529|nr:hypothetical protein [Salegentibacter sediminis]
MKTKFFFLLFFVITFSISAQNNPTDNDSLGGSYYFIQSPPGPLELQTRSDGKTDIGVPLDSKIFFIYEDEDYVYYKYWPFNSDKLKKIYNKFIHNHLTEDSIVSPNGLGYEVVNHFYMEKEKFRELTAPIYSHFKGVSVGAYTVPFRLRGIGGDFDFESALSLQANMILGFGSYNSERSWLDLSFGIGLTGVKLDPKNSDVLEDRTANAFTTSMGVLLKPKPYANLGMFLGWDFLGRNDNEVNWQYNKEPWLGLGINISFNEVTTERSPESEKGKKVKQDRRAD